MARFAKGDVIVVPFPFSIASGDKPRPALVLASWPCAGTTDYLVCMISSQNVNEPFIAPLNEDDFESGTLNRQSYIRPTYLWVVPEGRVIARVGTITMSKLVDIVATIKSALD